MCQTILEYRLKEMKKLMVHACHRIHDMSETPHMPVVDYIGPRNSQHAIAIIYEILSSGSMDKPLYV